MNWNEDTWEDVIRSPSPTFEDNTLSTNSSYINFHHSTADNIIQNGRPGDTSHSKLQQKTYPKNLLPRTKTEASDDSSSNNESRDSSHSSFDNEFSNSNGLGDGNNYTGQDNSSSNKTHTAVSTPSSNKPPLQNGSAKPRSDLKSAPLANKLKHSKNSKKATSSTSNMQNSVDERWRRFDTSPEVPESLCNNQQLLKQNKEPLRKSNSEKDIASKAEMQYSTGKDGQYSKVSSGNDTSSRGLTLYEYEKEKMTKRVIRERSFNNNNNYDYSNYYSEVNEDDDVDKVTAILCMVFCIMGVGVVFGLIFILVHYSEHREQKEFEKIGLNDTYSEFKNNVYYKRVASVIQSASFNDQQRWLYEKTSLKDNISKKNLDLCNLRPPVLVGNATDVILNITLTINDILVNSSDVTDGGEWKPPHCTSRHKVAVIIPYRDRWSHLKVLLYYLIPILKRQQIHFRIFVVEQFGNYTFNKGRIMNAAFREALKLFDFHCVTFHDVDLVPEDDRNMYSCTEQPKHMSIGIDKFNYILPYEGLVGGVLMFKTEQFELVNGYSNMYWGWGAEDDDMTSRIIHHGLRIYRPPSNIARYKMVKHEGREGSEVAVRMKLLKSAARRSKLEGLNNVQYKLLFTHVEKLFTHFVVDIGHP